MKVRQPYHCHPFFASLLFLLDLLCLPLLRVALRFHWTSITISFDRRHTTTVARVTSQTYILIIRPNSSFLHLKHVLGSSKQVIRHPGDRLMWCRRSLAVDIGQGLRISDKSKISSLEMAEPPSRRISPRINRRMNVCTSEICVTWLCNKWNIVRSRKPIGVIPEVPN